MKRSKIWKVIVGSIILLVVLGLSFRLINTRPERMAELIAQLVSIVSWGAVGGYLLFSYLADKDKEDAGVVQPQIAPNSQEDIMFLTEKRNKIMASVFLVELLAALPSWITHDFLSGLTPDNLSVMFDIFVNIFFAYFIFALYKNKPVLKYFIATVIFATCGFIAFDIWKDELPNILVEVFFVSYFIFYVFSKVNRRNYRLANFIILPSVIILATIAVGLITYKFEQLSKQELLVETEFGVSALDVNSKYTLFVQEKEEKNIPYRIEDLKIAIEEKKDKTEKLLTILDELKAEIEKLPKDDAMKKTEKKIEVLFRTLKAHQVLDDKMMRFAEFFKEVDMENFSDKQQTDYQVYVQEILTANNDVQELSKELLKQ